MSKVRTLALAFAGLLCGGALHAQQNSVAVPSAKPAERAPVDERAMKAAYLYNFALFTQWPKLTAQVFQFCVLGMSAVETELRRLEGRSVQNGLPLVVRNVTPGDNLSSCQLLYVDQDQRRLFGNVSAQLLGYPVLTVTDADGLIDAGAMIEVRRQGSRLTFDVNLPAAKRVKLDFSARLLKLASVVVGMPQD